MRWQAKARAFSLLSNIPNGNDLHYALQRYVTRRLPRPERQVNSIYNFSRRLLDLYSRLGTRPVEQSVFFEFGAGRDLILPLAVAAHAAKRFITVDIERLARLDLVRMNAEIISRLGDSPRPTLSSWNDLDLSWNVEYRAPSDAGDTKLDADSIDCAISVETLEHVPAQDILRILREVHRIVRPDGLILMQIDYGDHFKSFDPSISSFNFLTYSEDDWRPFQSRFQYVNRLRHSQYLDLFQQASFTIIQQFPDRRPPEAAILQRLAPCFRELSSEDLFTLGALIVARPNK